jgi:hypothetical protein
VSNRTDMLNGEDIVTIEEFVNDLPTASRDIFIRPSEDLKQFSGQVIDIHECVDWLNDAMSSPPESGSYYLNPKTKIVVATPKPIQAEWRWFIVGGKIVSGAMYRAHGQLIKKRELDVDVIQEAQRLADVWLPDSCVVMDTALVNDKLYVIEFNTINSSGFYGHDVSKIFSKLYQVHN